jgi:hypothetical protein
LRQRALRGNGGGQRILGLLREKGDDVVSRVTIDNDFDIIVLLAIRLKTSFCCRLIRLIISSRLVAALRFFANSRYTSFTGRRLRV